jgi:hypothetical protein
MRLQELIREDVGRQGYIKIGIPVTKAGELEEILPALGFPILDKRTKEGKVRELTVSNKFSSSLDRLTQVIRSRLNYEGRLEVRYM